MNRTLAHRTPPSTLTQAAQEAVGRFESLILHYLALPENRGDVLLDDTSAVHGIIADAFHFAKARGFDRDFAMIVATDTVSAETGGLY